MSAQPLTFRPAWPDEYPQLWRRFKIAFNKVPNVRLQVAASQRPRERIQACAAIHLPGSDDDQRVGFVTWYAAEAYQNLDVIAALLRSLMADQALESVFSIKTFSLFPEDNPQIGMLESLGFVTDEELFEYETSYPAVRDRARRIAAALERRNAIPTQARITGFQPAQLPAIRANYHRLGIMPAPVFDAKLDQGLPDAIDLPRSTQIVLDGELIGAMLVSPLPNEPGYSVLGRWVAEDFRNGWVNAALLDRSLQCGVGLGLKVARFMANRDNHLETQRLAARLGGHKHSHRLRMRLDVRGLGS